MLLLEILAVSAAVLILFLAGGMLIRSALTFRLTVKRLQENIEPKAMYLMDQSEAAQRRAFSIMDQREILLEKLWLIRSAMQKMRVIISAAQGAWKPVSRVLNYVGL